MFKNYSKSAWRTLWQNRFYSAINISGLDVSIMLSIWVQNELAMINLIKDCQQIYRLSNHFKSNGMVGICNRRNLALLIALLTVSFKAIKVAMANPVKSLRTK